MKIELYFVDMTFVRTRRFSELSKLNPIWKRLGASGDPGFIASQRVSTALEDVGAMADFHKSQILLCIKYSEPS